MHFHLFYYKLVIASLFLLGIVPYYAFNCTLTHGAELSGDVVSHAAHDSWTVHSFGHISTTFVDSYGVVFLTFLGRLSGNLCPFVEHICPL